ncbi:hypothetical protein HGI30_06150 [Paenibacillus albicereus]|uniref:DUF4309 domain-containing protein n=1 Tax=Paenibacillus albicereus TaxID=2726185 RepID=A0A6H2GVJ5_9BACL|nr:hypothetical protein [Paenibacillus albicereus]QJC51186.1 hypothetical protein HGI30_06150 [Paenibacillus albicereus]
MKRIVALVAAACLLMTGVTIGVLMRPAYAPAPMAAAGPSVPDELAAALVSPAYSAYLDLEASEPAEPAETEMDFSEVNGVGLYDAKEQVVTEIGIPQSAQRDELLPEQTAWSYPGMEVGFSGGSVEYVSVPVGADPIQLESGSLPVSVEGWEKVFGEPMFTADDGVGYVDERGFAAKLFLDSRSGELVSIDFFWSSSTE